MNGFVPKLRTKRVESSLPTSAGAERFSATIVTSLTFAEIDAIPLHQESTYPELFEAMAPFVLEWNALAFNHATGEYDAVPPPAIAGPNALRAVPTEISLFLAAKLKTVHLGDDDERPKESKPSDDTHAGRPETTSDSTSTTTKTRTPKSRKDTG